MGEYESRWTGFMGQKVGIGIELNSVSGGFLVAGTPSDVEITDQMPWPLGLNVGNYNADHKLNIVPNFGFNLQMMIRILSDSPFMRSATVV
jgi:hypothetical protein